MWPANTLHPKQWPAKKVCVCLSEFQYGFTLSLSMHKNDPTCVMITYNIYIVIRETGQFSSKGIIHDFIGNLNRLTVSRRFTEQAV